MKDETDQEMLPEVSPEYEPMKSAAIARLLALAEKWEGWAAERRSMPPDRFSKRELSVWRAEAALLENCARELRSVSPSSISLL